MFQNKADWTPLSVSPPPLENYCVVIRMPKTGGHTLFTGWARRDDRGRLWWWSTLKWDTKSLSHGEPTRLFACVKSTDYWFRLTLPVDSHEGGEDVRLDESYNKKIDKAYAKRLTGKTNRASKASKR